MDLTNTYWHSNGTYKSLAMKLQSLVPRDGEVKGSPALERFRRASNAYHRFYNDGMAWRFGLKPGKCIKFNDWTHEISDERVREIEAIMDETILAAAKEQNLISDADMFPETSNLW